MSSGRCAKKEDITKNWKFVSPKAEPNANASIEDAYAPRSWSKNLILPKSIGSQSTKRDLFNAWLNSTVTSNDDQQMLSKS